MSSSQEALPRYEAPPPAYRTLAPTRPIKTFSQTRAINIGQIICYIAPGSILKFQNPNNIQVEVSATVKRYYGEDYTLFQRVLIIRNYVKAQLFRLVEEFKLVDASYNLKSTPKEMVAYLEQALQYIYTDLNHSGLTHGGLPLLIYHSKTTYSNAIQKGGSILQPHYFEHDTPEVREVTKGLIEGKRVEVERAVGSVVCERMMAERRKREGVAV
ncbi:hypothetical protein I350_04591 [Cryptococcus amylolentus CBS 6273]|uniref:Uncharacterized protein n=1 Tax=Cryptococcus amylolentus CBS 6273 TaxID=1296118 RepID=A0A1E3JXH2_9TREE|nr:hypothetical protein I350_04591 [Cryptococcus amylolentus CBS 6273]